VNPPEPRDAGGLRGIGASPGIAIGSAYVVRREMLILPEYRVAEGSTAAEVERLREAIAHASQQLEAIRTSVADFDLVETIVRTQIAILEDRQLFEDAARRIREERINAEWAVGQELQRLDRLFGAIQDPYLRERRADVNFVVRRLLLNLMGREPEGFRDLVESTIVVANDLSPAEVAQFDRSRVVGFATDAGGRASHAAIMANSLQIPAVVGLESITSRVEDGDQVIVDGRSGRVLLRPDAATVHAYRERCEAERTRERELLRISELPDETRDGLRIRLLANIERSDEIPSARLHGARGIGLFRTEFLYMNRAELPSEDEQFCHYRAVVEGMAPDWAAIRTVDLGGDKLPIPGARRSEANPALGLRGVRLARIGEVTRTQLRAMLRASPYGRLRILLPLVTGVEEVREVRSRLEEVRAELEAEGVSVSPDVQLGVVVETPAAVSLVDLLAPEIDFFSIGTNDLIQYTIAVDRENEHVAYLYDPSHPAVLRAIRTVVQKAHAAGQPVAVCGEMAGDPLYSLVLIGLGVDELSMNAPSIPRVKCILRQTHHCEARMLVAELLTLSTSAEVGDRLHKEMLRRFPEEFEGV
jgi:phosphotransferase system enzyme I (PtsI)